MLFYLFVVGICSLFGCVESKGNRRQKPTTVGGFCACAITLEGCSQNNGRFKQIKRWIIELMWTRVFLLCVCVVCWFVQTVTFFWKIGGRGFHCSNEDHEFTWGLLPNVVPLGCFQNVFSSPSLNAVVHQFWVFVLVCDIFIRGKRTFLELKYAMKKLSGEKLFTLDWDLFSLVSSFCYCGPKSPLSLFLFLRLPGLSPARTELCAPYPLDFYVWLCAFNCMFVYVFAFCECWSPSLLVCFCVSMLV